MEVEMYSITGLLLFLRRSMDDLALTHQVVCYLVSCFGFKVVVCPYFEQVKSQELFQL